MKLRTAHLALIPVILLCHGTSHAEDTFVYGKLGTGATVGIGRMINESFSVRGGVGAMRGPSYDRDIGGVRYDIKPESSSALSAIVDWYPISGSGFRVSGGVTYFNRNTHELTAPLGADGNYRINGNTYSAAEAGQLTGKVGFKKFVPYLGIGWESAAANKPGWRFISDLGLQFDRGGSASLSSSGGAGNAALQQDIVAEQRRVTSDFDGTRVHLGLSIGAAYSF